MRPQQLLLLVPWSGVAGTSSPPPPPTFPPWTESCPPKTNALDVLGKTISENNLGGGGPTSGAEEIRFEQATLSASGDPLDVVLTTSSSSTYLAKNAAGGAPLGSRPHSTRPLNAPCRPTHRQRTGLRADGRVDGFERQGHRNS